MNIVHQNAAPLRTYAVKSSLFMDISKLCLYRNRPNDRSFQNNKSIPRPWKGGRISGPGQCPGRRHDFPCEWSDLAANVRLFSGNGIGSVLNFGSNLPQWRSAPMQNEIIFMVSNSPEGGFEARALGHGIFTEADSMDELKAMIQDAVACHFDDDKRPAVIRLHFDKMEAAPEDGPPFHDLDHLFGRWTEEEFQRIQGKIDEERRIDPELWN
ncbi:MAG: hypothetical protein ACLFTV_09195 [Desulfococcaceae bacterium]